LGEDEEISLIGLQDSFKEIDLLVGWLVLVMALVGFQKW